MATYPTRLYKQLRPAKIIGIILFVMSIVGFAGNLAGALGWYFIKYFIGVDFPHADVFSDPMDWIFNHYTILAFSLSLFCIPLFFSARALLRYKEWGRIVCIIMMFLLMLIIAGMGYSFIKVRFVPQVIQIYYMIVFAIYTFAPLVPVIFLTRQGIIEGIKKYNQYYSHGN